MVNLQPAFIEKKKEIGDLCRHNHVQFLDLFGSAVQGSFNEGSSDLDFLVHFGPISDGSRFDAFMSLADGLEALFNRRVDLVVDDAIENPYFRKAVDVDRVRLYERGSE